MEKILYFIQRYWIWILLLIIVISISVYYYNYNKKLLSRNVTVPVSTPIRTPPDYGGEDTISVQGDILQPGDVIFTDIAGRNTQQLQLDASQNAVYVSRNGRVIRYFTVGSRRLSKDITNTIQQRGGVVTYNATLERVILVVQPSVIDEDLSSF